MEEGQNVIYEGKHTHIEVIHGDGTCNIKNPYWNWDEEDCCVQSDVEYGMNYWITVKLSELKPQIMDENIEKFIDEELIVYLTLRGIDATRAGTILRNVFIKLQSGIDKFNPAVVGMNKSLVNLKKEEFSIAELTKMFGLENIATIQILIDGSQE